MPLVKKDVSRGIELGLLNVITTLFLKKGWLYCIYDPCTFGLSGADQETILFIIDFFSMCEPG